MAPPIFPAPARTTVPLTFCKALLEFTDVTTNDSSSLRTQGPITTTVLVYRDIGNKRCTMQLPSRRMGPCFRRDDQYFHAGHDDEVLSASLRLALGVEHRGAHRFGRRLAGPDHELEGGKVALAGVERAHQHDLALRGRGGHPARQHQRLTVHDHAGVGPDIEMPDP